MIKKSSAISFCAALLIHLLLFVALFFSIEKKSEIPQVTMVIDVSTLGEVVKKKKDQKKSDPEKHNPEQGKDYHLHTEGFGSDIEQNLRPIFNPLPQIPDDLRDEAFLSEAIARFFIDESGSVARVELIKPCANPRLNNLLLKSLRNWKFSATKKDSTQDIKVKFKVE